MQYLSGGTGMFKEGDITATAAEDGHYSANPRFSVNEDPSDAPPNAGAEEVAAATGNEPAASSVPASGAPERDNKWPDGTLCGPACRLRAYRRLAGHNRAQNLVVLFEGDPPRG